MEIAGFKFRLKKDESVYGGPGVLLFKHTERGVFFVKSVDCCRRHTGRRNYPRPLKDLLERDRSDVLMYVCEFDRYRREDLDNATRVVKSYLQEAGSLYRRDQIGRGEYDLRVGEQVPRFTVWSMTDRKTGAVFYFPEKTGIQVSGKVNQRMVTFNGYVMKKNVHANRSMYNFAKKNFPLTPGQWVVRDLELDFESEELAEKHITKLARTDLQNAVIVLSKICDTDPLTYRNDIMRMPMLSMEVYITAKA